jgi:hypothetical protein
MLARIDNAVLKLRHATGKVIDRISKCLDRVDPFEKSRSKRIADFCVVACVMSLVVTLFVLIFPAIMWYRWRCLGAIDGIQVDDVDTMVRQYRPAIRPIPVKHNWLKEGF